jgi:hypothetical protein
MADKKHMEETLQQWADGFFAQAENQGMLEQFGIDSDDARLIIEEFTRDMFASSGREVRRWTRKSVLAMLNQKGSSWLKLTDEQWLDAASVMYAYMAYLQNQHHMDNADTISSALDDFGDAQFSFSDMEDDDDFGGAKTADDGFNPSIPIMKLAALYGEDEQAKGDITAFAHDHLSELVMLADGADGMDLILLSALAAGQTSPSDEFLNRWFDQVVRPEIDFDSIASEHKLNLTKPEQRRKAEKMVLDSFVNDPSELPSEIRMQFAARIDGDPIVDAASQMRFFARHDKVLRRYFGFNPDASATDEFDQARAGQRFGQANHVPTVKTAPHKPAKVIDFASARKKLEEKN